MALNTGTANGTFFNQTNMKPESGNQVDALWGANMSDNQACFFARDHLMATILGADVRRSGTVFFKKMAPHDNFVGTIYGTYSSLTGGADNGYIRIQANGVEIASGTYLGASPAEIIAPFSYDASALTNHETYPLTWGLTSSAHFVGEVFGCNVWAVMP